jgi:signal transduction histidine kinase
MRVWSGLRGKQNRKLDGREQKLARLAAWPRVMPSDLRSVLREALEHSARIFGAPRTLITWEEPDEPWLRLATITDGALHMIEESPAKYDPVVNDQLWGLSFFCLDLTEPEMSIYWNSPGGLQQLRGTAIHPDLRKDYNITSVLGLKLDGETVQGHLFVLDLPEVTREDLMFGEVMAGLIASRMDQMAFRQAQRQAVAEERVRLARDLHDGLLQSFTGVVLQLETVHEILQKRPEEARRMLTQLQGVIMSEQRELRAFVDELRPQSRRAAAGLDFDFRARLEDLRERFRNEWRVNFDYQIGSMSPLVAGSLGQETFRLIAEAATNSAKHGEASNIRVTLFTANDRLHIAVQDDGSGFPFRGRYDLAALDAMDQAPASLSGRVTSLNGDLVIESSDAGAHLEITVPLGLRES